ncbi:MAG: hypothetical protein J6O60_08965 [Lachnospiraceae bacterium]|nr:hypothetical protein [Lachnospiraceae bacterium]
MKYNKLLFFVYTFLDVLYMILMTVIAFTGGASESDLLFAIRFVGVFSWILLIYELFYFIYRIKVLYRKSKHRSVWSGLMIALIVLVVLNNIAAIAASSIGSAMATLANILALITWIYDIKLIFLDD